MAAVRILPRAERGLTHLVRCGYDRRIVQAVRALPQRQRRWDREARAWRVQAGVVDVLILWLRAEGFVVIDERP